MVSTEVLQVVNIIVFVLTAIATYFNAHKIEQTRIAVEAIFRRDLERIKDELAQIRERLTHLETKITQLEAKLPH